MLLLAFSSKRIILFLFVFQIISGNPAPLDRNSFPHEKFLQIKFRPCKITPPRNSPENISSSCENPRPPVEFFFENPPPQFQLKVAPWENYFLENFSPRIPPLRISSAEFSWENFSYGKSPSWINPPDYSSPAEAWNIPTCKIQSIKYKMHKKNFELESW